MLLLRAMLSSPRSSRWSGAARCQGILVYTDNGIGHLHGRRVDLNMVDIPRSSGDLHHTNLVFERAGASVAV